MNVKRAYLASLAVAGALLLLLLLLVGGTGAASRIAECVETCHANGYACAGQASCECGCAAPTAADPTMRKLDKEECTVLKDAMIEEYQARMNDDEEEEKDDDRLDDVGSFGLPRQHEHNHDFHRSDLDDHHARSREHLDTAVARAQGICAAALGMSDGVAAQCPAFAPGTSAAARYDGARVRVPAFAECTHKHRTCLKRIATECVDHGVLIASVISAAGAAAALLAAACLLAVPCLSGRSRATAYARTAAARLCGGNEPLAACGSADGANVPDAHWTQQASGSIPFAKVVP